MKRYRLILRSLIHYWRTNLAVVAGVSIAVAVLGGALLVGKSVRGSLRDLLFERIGSTEFLVASEHFFSEGLSAAFEPDFSSCPVIYMKGVVTREKSRIRAYNVNVFGIDERFWKFHGVDAPHAITDRSAWVGDGLAKQIGIQSGDGLLLKIENPQAIPKEWLYGRRDDVGKTLRLTCGDILPENRLGDFVLRPIQGNVYTIFVPLKRLQKDIGQQAKANAILLGQSAGGNAIASVQNKLRKACSLQDLGLAVIETPSRGIFSVESSHIILDDQTAQAALGAAASMGARASPIYSYLANSIRANGREIPYSVVTAADVGRGALQSVKSAEFTQDSMASEDGPIWLTDWAKEDLSAALGSAVELDYYVWQQEGKLETRTTRFHLAGVVPTGGDVNTTLTPQIPGVTDARTINSWNPPFPLDYGRIRREDEDYWNRYKATPKAFVSLAKGQALWGSRFGKTTAIRIALGPEQDPQSGKARFSGDLLNRLNPLSTGISITDIKEQGLAASRGSTDFGEYFLYFSSFLIAAALLLAILFFKLMVEQRSREIGILAALGYSYSRLRRNFLWEGMLLSLGGSIGGMSGSVAYAWLMLYGLRTWWVGAVGTQRLSLHISWAEMATAAASGAVLSLISMAWALRTLSRNSPRMLLSGSLESTGGRRRRARTMVFAAVSLMLAAGSLLLGSIAGKISPLAAFFGAGFLALISLLSFAAAYLRRVHRDPIDTPGLLGFAQLGLRNATHRTARSVLCTALIASATFIVISMEAFRQDSDSLSLDPKSGTGGFSLVAEASLPILYDPGSDTGREELGIDATRDKELRSARFVPFRQRPGDDASCLNLYAAQQPTILAVSKSFRSESRFSFQSSLAVTPEQKKNPWLLLDSKNDAFIPAIADANTLQYMLHLSIGSELLFPGSTGSPVRLKFVAALNDSLFQGKILIAESRFLQAFPDQEGYRFFLIETPGFDGSAMIPSLQESLADWGLSVQSTYERLAALHRVENTYLSTFQSLGVLGLILGTIGLATILLRNALERRWELAFMRAVGYSKTVLAFIVLAENLWLLAWGLFSGFVCAAIAILPALHSRGGSLPLGLTGSIIVAVLLAGMGSSYVAAAAALRSPILDALRSE
jgi:hypothetical protein